MQVEAHAYLSWALNVYRQAASFVILFGAGKPRGLWALQLSGKQSR
jgi:hypothetical protein